MITMRRRTVFLPVVKAFLSLLSFFVIFLEYHSNYLGDPCKFPLFNLRRMGTASDLGQREFLQLPTCGSMCNLEIAWQVSKLK